MDRIRGILDALRAIFRYAPYFWLGVRTLFELWKARLRQKAVHDALEKERERRLAAERELGLSESRAGTLVDRADRALSRAVAREYERRRRAGLLDGDTKPD